MKLGIVMDPIESINYKKDSSLDIMIEACQRKYDLSYILPTSLHINERGAFAEIFPIRAYRNPDKWFDLGDPEIRKLSELDVIIMRQDPPFDMSYITTTHILEKLSKKTLVVNNPLSLRDCNEKVFATEFSQCCTPFLVASNKDLLRLIKITPNNYFETSGWNGRHFYI